MGLVDFIYVALSPEGQPDLSLVTYIPRPRPREPGSPHGHAQAVGEKTVG